MSLLNNAKWQTRKNASMARGEGNLASLFVEKALNAEVWDVEGKRYIDFGSGIAVCNTGHTHPKVTQACLLYTSPSPRDATLSRMPSSA